MNIQEAIKSGKRYRRKGEKSWYDTAPDFTHHAFSTRDVLSDDWEVEPPTVTITRNRYSDAWHRASIDLQDYNVSPSVLRRFRDLIAKELGFENY